MLRKHGFPLAIVLVVCFVSISLFVPFASAHPASAQHPQQSCAWTNTHSGQYGLPGGYAQAFTWDCNIVFTVQSVHGQGAMLCNYTCSTWRLYVKLWWNPGNDGHLYNVSTYTNLYYSTGTLWTPNTGNYCANGSSGSVWTEVQVWNNLGVKQLDFNSPSSFVTFSC